MQASTFARRAPEDPKMRAHRQDGAAVVHRPRFHASAFVPAREPPLPRTATAVLALQRTAGNRAVRALIGRTAVRVHHGRGARPDEGLPALPRSQQGSNRESAGLLLQRQRSTVKKDSRLQRVPPGSGAFTKAEYREWLARHPKRILSIGDPRDYSRYTPEWFSARGYFYAGRMHGGYAGAVIEVWLSDAGTGREFRVFRELKRQRDASFERYIALVEQLEERLGLDWPGGAPEALSVLRQLYYGSGPWSNNPEARWDDIIPTPRWSPTQDPRPLAGEELVDALKAQQRVAGIDLGHVFTGLEAMLRPGEVTMSQGAIAVVVGTRNEEFATWSGDVGSAAAEWVTAALASAGGRELPSFARYFTRFASDADLLGDLDSFALRTGLAGGTAAVGQQLRLPRDQRLSEILRSYYAPKGSLVQARQHRVRSFVETYGGQVSRGKLKNPQVLRQRLWPSVDEFASAFLTGKFLKGQLGANRTGIDNQELKAMATRAMTKLFVAWLARQLDAESTQ